MTYRLSRTVITVIIFFTAIASSTIAAFSVNIEGEESRSPSMSIESGEEPIEDESVTLDVIDSKNSEGEDSEIAKEETDTLTKDTDGPDAYNVHEAEYEKELIFGIKKKVVILLVLLLGVMTLFILTLIGIRRRKRRRKTKNK